MTTNTDEIDWENILNFDDGVDNLDCFTAVGSPPEKAAVDTVVAELEDILMKDDDNNNGGVSDDYFRDFDFEVSDLLLDIPEIGGEPLSVEAEVVNTVVEDKNSPVSSASVGNVVVEGGGGGGGVNGGLNFQENSPNFESNCEDDKSGDGDDDPLSKKRKRQLKNRDAAMRSRERKKKFVKELEMKSRYFEEECRRLGRLLNWCYAENQMLRISLQTYGAPMTNPESAVLLLESLLLGSLVWLMVNICLLPQPKLPLLNQRAAKLVSVDRNVLENATPRGKGTKISEPWIFLSFMRSRRCRASRTKMKPRSDVRVF